MHKEQLFAAMDGIDETLIQRSEEAKPMKSALWKWCTLAACLCLIVTVSILYFQNGDQPGKQGAILQQETTLPPETSLPQKETYDWTVHYIQKTPDIHGLDIAVNPIAYQKDLNDAEMEAVLPDDRPQWLQGTGYAGFSKEQQLKVIRLELETPLDDRIVTVGISKAGGSGCVVHPSDRSVCNGVEFTVYEYNPSKEYVTLEAEAWMQDYSYYFRLSIVPDDLQQAKTAFKQILECFTCYATADNPGLTEITFNNVPETYDATISWEEARNDEDFGTYAPITAPEGAETGARRYVGFRSDYLELYWKEGESELRWTISHYDRKQYANRMTSVFDIYRYGNGTGLLFEAEDITKELVTRSVLTSRKRISFGIRYEGFLIEIQGESVDRTWLWEQLVAIGIVAAEEDTDYTFTEISGIDMLAMYEDEPLGRYAPRMESFIGWSVWKYESEQKSYLELTRSWFPEDPQYLTIQITAFADESKLVRPDEREKYDLSTHSTGPWDPDIPEQYSGIMPRPVFEASEITPDMVRSRVYYNQADRTAPRMEFGVRYGDVVVYVFSIGLSPDEIYNYIQSISPEEP